MSNSIIHWRFRWCVAIGIVSLQLLRAGITSAGTFLANWQGANGGTWSTSTNWDINQVPSNTVANTYSVRVDAGTK